MSGKRKRDEDYVERNVNIALGGSFQELADSEEGPHTGVASLSSVPSPDYLRYFATKEREHKSRNSTKKCVTLWMQLAGRT